MAEIKEVVKDNATVERLNRQEGLRVVKPKEPVTVVWTEKSKYHAPGTTSIVHRVAAEKFVAAGKATIKKGK